MAWLTEWLTAVRNAVRPRPLRWDRGAGRPLAARPRGVNVVVPIYGAPEELHRCLDSLARHTDLERHRVTLVIDGPQEPAVEAIVGRFSAAHRNAVDVIRNEGRLGFAATANRGMSSSEADVVLLNSDTIVTARWLEKLMEASYSNGDIGTVTPLSNHATLCSVPRAFEENLIPAGFDIDSFAALVESVSARSRPVLPTGVGFCLYIRRALLDDVGLFDEKHFATGYGEENDLCLRALARGWLHVADDATFVYHAGQRSFGASSVKRQRHARRVLSRKHRRYMSTIAQLMKVDPLGAVRARIVASLAPRPDAKRMRVVHLVHGWPPFQHAGTELYAYWLVQRQRATHDVSVYARASDPARAEGTAVELDEHGTRVRLVTNNFTARNPLRRNAIRDRALERDFGRFLDDEHPDLVHVHHLAGHAFSLLRVAQRRRIPVVLQIQDWWFLCARVNRFDHLGNRCTGGTPAKCASCATLTKIAPAPLTNRLLHVLRRNAARAALGASHAFIAGSNAIRDDYAAFVPKSTPFHVIPYGIALSAPREKRAAARRPVRFGYVGSIAPHKGVHIAVEAMNGLDRAAASLHIWGDADANPEYVAPMKKDSAVVFEGRFREDDKARVFASMDVLLVPSIGLESFGLAAREAMVSGVPVIASAGGALNEMFAPGECGELFPAGDAAALRTILRRIAGDPSIIDRWAERLPRPKSDEMHAAEIASVYESVLGE